VRAAAASALAGAIVVPLVRRRLRIPGPVTAAAVASGPVGLAVLLPRTKARDTALFVLHMWAFTVVHELPYDDPERLRRRLKVRYPLRLDRALGLGELPNVRLQRAFARLDQVTAVDRILAVVHWAWFAEPHVALLWLLIRNNARFARAATQMAAVFDVGCLVYYAVPTAPPWWAAQEGYMAEEEGTGEAEIVAEAAPPRLRRVMVEVGEGTWGRAWPALYDSLGGNPWAAMPSLHFSTSLIAATLLAESGPIAGGAGWAYAGTLAFALIYLGEHYAVDLLAGGALVAVVRRAGPVAAPALTRASHAVQCLERLAAG
jgi:membrane-associated phospholipid phosphatase